MNIVEKMLDYREQQDPTIFESSHKFDSANLNVIVIEILSWLKLERKREIWIEQGRKTSFKPLKLNLSFPWCNDLVKLTTEKSIFSDIFYIEGNLLNFNDNISEEYIHEARILADEKYDPQMIIG